MISQRLKDLRKGYRLTEEAYELVEWTKDNRCYCSACSMPPCGSCENGLPEDIAYEYDEYWEVDPEYEEEVVMSRSEIVNKSTTKDSPKFKVGDRVKIKKNSRFYEGTRNNPKDILGRIAFFSKGVNLNIRVDWDNGGSEDYSENDLELAETKLDNQEEKVDTITAHNKWLEDVAAGRTGDVYMRDAGWVSHEKIQATISNLINQQEEINMTQVTTRKTVTVNLIDRDSALDEKYSLVAAFGEFVTSKSTEALIRSIMIDPENDVAGCIAAHNELRIDQVDRDILKRTGNKVMLEPIEESDLYWEIS